MAARSIRSRPACCRSRSARRPRPWPTSWTGQKRYRFTARWGEARTTDDAEGEVVATSERRPERGRDRGRAARVRRHARAGAAPLRRGQGRRASGLTTWRAAARRSSWRRATIEVESFVLVEQPDRDHAIFELRMRPRHLCAGADPRPRRAARLPRPRGRAAPAAGGPVPRRGGALARGARAAGRPRTRLPQALLPVSAALGELPALALTEPQAASAARRPDDPGRPGPDRSARPSDDATVRAMAAGQMVALARLHGGELSPVRVFNL